MKTLLIAILLSLTSVSFANYANNIDPNDGWNVYSDDDPVSWNDDWNVPWTWDDTDD